MSTTKKSNKKSDNAKVEKLLDLTSARYKIAYDVQSTPDRTEIGALLQIADLHHFLFWDSSKKGKAPEVYYLGESDENTSTKFQLVDTAGNHVEYAALIEAKTEELKWIAELEKCKKSPIYYYNNYISLTLKPNGDDCSTWMAQMGMIADKVDTAVALEGLSEKEIKAREKFSAKLTILRLQSLKAKRDKALAIEAENTKSRLEALCMDGKTVKEMEAFIIQEIAAYDAKASIPVLKGTDFEDYIFIDLDAKPDQEKEAWAADVLEVTDLEYLTTLKNLLDNAKVPKSAK